ncbi:MAG TPA: hypothetical protein VFR85_19725 [Anaeromyxobacteraceae bacterium]|nr:hypothetical protein [Anaeromyxobacteraceae bacterium]
MLARLAILGLALAAGCRSSAPYTVPAAALNTGVAVGAALGQRASGGCYATCTHGTVCNPRNGLCESATAAEVCDQGETGEVRCVPVMGVGVSRPAEEPAGAPKPPFGLSPATGGVPPPPAEASPKPPGAP